MSISLFRDVSLTYYSPYLLNLFRQLSSSILVSILYSPPVGLIREAGVPPPPL